MIAPGFGPEFGKAQRRRRRLGLTPMIDVIFLLLVFFMLAARFGVEATVPLSPGGAGSAGWQGPPRLVTILSDEAVLLNGVATARADLAAAVAPLMPDRKAPVILRAGPEARLQDVLDIAAALRAAGIDNLVFAR